MGGKEEEIHKTLKGINRTKKAKAKRYVIKT